MNTVPFKPLRPRMVAMPHKVLLTNTLVGTTSTDEVLALRHLAGLAELVTDFPELQDALHRARLIRSADDVLAKTSTDFQLFTTTATT